MQTGNRAGKAWMLALIFLVATVLCAPCPPGDPCREQGTHSLDRASGAPMTRIVPATGLDFLPEGQTRRLAAGMLKFFPDGSKTARHTRLAAAFLLVAVTVWLCLIDLRVRQIVCRGGIHAPPVS